MTNFKQWVELHRDSNKTFWRAIIALKDFIFWNFISMRCFATKFFRKIIYFSSKLEGNNRDQINKDNKKIENIISRNSKEKVHLTNSTFVIPVRCDSIERKRNLECSIRYIQTFFNTNIIVGEEDSEKHFEYLKKDIKYMFFKSDSPFFHKTKVVNLMTNEAKTEFIINYDLDALINPHDIVYAIDMLKNGFDAVYPFDGNFLHLNDKKSDELRENILTGKDLKLNIQKKDYYKRSHNSVGGVFMINKKKMIASGMENENFLSWSWHDLERDIRSRKLGLKIARTFSPLIHLNHPRGTNSSTNNIHHENNCRECEKVNSMTKKELQEYIKTWAWLQNANQTQTSN